MAKQRQLSQLQTFIPQKPYEREEYSFHSIEVLYNIFHVSQYIYIYIYNLIFITLFSVFMTHTMLLGFRSHALEILSWCMQVTIMLYFYNA